VPDDLERFAAAQDPLYPAVLDELRRGHKTGHWMWFIFPQLRGLGSSEMARFYGITSLAEARAYLGDAVLGSRLRECAGLVLASGAPTAEGMLGPVDARKLRSSMTLFHRAAPEDATFSGVLDRYYDGVPDEATDELLVQPESPGHDVGPGR
jgi:uncharacterized protein (DUF1810 family)